MHLFQPFPIQVNSIYHFPFFLYSSSLDAVVDQSLSSVAALNKSASDLLSLAHFSSSQTPLSSSISTVNAQTLPNVSISPSNSTHNSTLLFQKPSTTNISSSLQTQTVRPATTTNFQFVNTNSSNTVRPIIFHQKPTTNSNQPQLLTVMPAGVRVQQLTPVVRSSSTTQPTTIVRLMSPATTTVRPGGTGQQQFIQLNTNKQQQPLVIKAITTQTSNRQQQPILLAANTQQKTSTPQTQQQVLVFNQNASGQQPKFTLQMANLDQSNTTTHIDNGQHESTMDNGRIPQLDGSVDDQVRILSYEMIFPFLLFSFL